MYNKCIIKCIKKEKDNMTTRHFFDRELDELHLSMIKMVR